MAKKIEIYSDQLALNFDSGDKPDQSEPTESTVNAVRDSPPTPVSNRVPSNLRFPDEHCLKALTDWSLFPRLLTIQEASWLTSTPTSTLYKWHAEGKLQKVAKTIGKQLRFDREALLHMWTHEKSKGTK